MIIFITIKIHIFMVLETKLVFTSLVLMVPLGKDKLNIKEPCYGINSRLILKVSHPLILILQK